MAPSRRRPLAVLSTVRIGQLTGSRGGPTWPDLVDPQRWPLQNDTGPYGVLGVDLGANTRHGNRTYIFFGDVSTKQAPDDIENSDLVAWTDDASVIRHGGHLPRGWTFVLPFEPTAVEGQRDWQFCLKCGALFWNGDSAFKGACPRGGAHDTFGVGSRFVLPFEPTGAAGQQDWRFCGKCASIFWDGDPEFKGVCPAGGVHASIGLHFVLPANPPAGTEGQSDWRFCGNCAGLFWDGDIFKGVCAGAPGGGFRLHPVLQPSGHFDPFAADAPIRETRSLETPNGAFSFDGRVYVFAGIAAEQQSHSFRPDAPALGQYLFSKADPSIPGGYQTEYLFSPRMGWCATDASRTSFQSHDVRGLRFFLEHDRPASPGRVDGWRSCRKCQALFWNGNPAFRGVCQREGAHEIDPQDTADYSLAQGTSDDAQDQANWRQCGKCLDLFFEEGTPAGLCPTGGVHNPVGVNQTAPHASIAEDAKRQAHWRYCGKCAGLFFAGSDDRGACPRDHLPHQALGFDFVLAHDVGEDAGTQTDWRCCGKCGGLFYDGFLQKGRCPKDGAGHAAAGYVFSLPHDQTPTLECQIHWRFCGKCAGLFFDGSADKGFCAVDGLGHQSAGLDFGLSHNPGEDATGSWRFCIRCHGMVRDNQRNWAAWIAPVVVDNSKHSNLPSHVGTGLVMIGFDWAKFRLAWMPLHAGTRPRFDAIHYYHSAQKAWCGIPDDDPDSGIFRHSHPGQYSHVSATWLDGPQRWIVLYGTASDSKPKGAPYFQGPVVARISPDLLTWTDEIPLFDPVREGAYGISMHMPGKDRIFPLVPPSDPAAVDHPGWAYGAFILESYTTWDAEARILSLFYLLSFAYPYQVQVMHSSLRIP